MIDLISRQAALTAIQNAYCDTEGGEDKCAVWKNVGLTEALHIMQDLPPAQPEQTDCEYCHEDSDGYVRPIEKNSHAWLVRRGRTMKLRVGFKGEYRDCDILYCPMCGRRLTDG